ncbi:hypothetical protein [uncultured Fibrobacter sp.]|uniref:hypothetical protein n=1 Tax=uncultured Fibrobacter sp. TaxID=261512 RepID=UPI0028053679|nr:hypothetical protein [uncultured Fibrobacter sp.]
MNEPEICVRLKLAGNHPVQDRILAFATIDVANCVRLRSVRVRQSPSGHIYAEFPHVPGGRNGDYYHSIDPRFTQRVDSICAAAYRDAILDQTGKEL